MNSLHTRRQATILNNVINTDNLVLTGDIHFGNPFFHQTRSFTSFLDYLCDNNIDLCINGDGIDILQLSLSKALLDLPQILKHLEVMASRNLKIYYIIGNHDIYFEQFLNRWDNFIVVPFLDVISGGRRIHIEHGHLHDRLFVHHPTFYKYCMIYSGYFLKLLPLFYRLFMNANRWFINTLAKARFISKEHAKDKARLIDAGKELLRRGYDAVIFGHSHRLVQLTMDGGGEYFNTGSWMNYPNHYIEINKGAIDLRTWDII